MLDCCQAVALSAAPTKLEHVGGPGMFSLREICRHLLSVFGCCGSQDIADDAFYQEHYGNSNVPRDIPIRVRKVFIEQLGTRWNLVRPEERPTDEDEELDLADLLNEVEHEFNIKIPLVDMRQLDGSFDSIVQYVAKNRDAANNKWARR